MTKEQLLAAYDAHLREEGELAGAHAVERHGPVVWAEFSHGGFVTYRTLGGLVGAELDRLIAETVAHFRDATSVRTFEWKTRGHDAPADLPERLAAHGLVGEEVETVMLGEARLLAVDVDLPEGVVVRRIGDGHDTRVDVERMVALQDSVFSHRGPTAASVLEEILLGENEYWIAEAEGRVVSAGRLQPVRGTPFAGLWGGCTDPGWRGRGIYRALVSARARSALDRGIEFMHSDCTAMSRPILERSGLVAVTTTTPYVWTR
ncbi:MAG: GNAT family N-acetyltransferase [Nocardioides sp.]|nr:GNAT family N-acetyltransferase [Nocardioides sp.]